MPSGMSRYAGAMPDDQRKAMFARLSEGGGSAYSPAGAAGRTGSSWKSYKDRLTYRDKRLLSGTLKPKTDAESTRLDLLKKAKLTEEGWTQRKDGNWERYTHAPPAPTPKREGLFADVQDALYPWLTPSHWDLNPTKWDWQAITAAMPAAGMVGTLGTATSESISWGRVGLRAAQSALAGGLAYEIGETRRQNPTMDPETEHYMAMGEDLAKTVSAITGLLGAKDAVLKMFPGFTGKAGEVARWIGDQLEAVGGTVAEKIPAPVLDKLGKVKSTYDAIADFTGAELPQLTKAGSVIGDAQQALALSERAAATRTQAQAVAEAATAKAAALRTGAEPSVAAAHLETLATKVETKAGEFAAQASSIDATATAKGESVRAFALDALNDSHVMSLLDDPAAKSLYDEAAGKFFATLRGEAGSAANSADLADIAARLTAKATEIRGRIPGAIQAEAEAGVASSAEAVAALLEDARLVDSQAAQAGRAAALDAAKIAAVVGGAAGIHAYEQGKVADYKQQIETAWSGGKSWTLPVDPDYADTPLTLAANFAIGTLGNPLEKQSRNYFNGRYTLDLAKRAAYEAKYDGIQKEFERGVLSTAERDAQLQDLAQYKPYNLAGRSLYSFTPATAGMLKYTASVMTDSTPTFTLPPAMQTNQYYSAGQTLNDVGNVLGVGLLTSGQSGAFTAMGNPGKIVAQTWNAAMSAFGTVEHALRGNKNTGKTYKPPADPVVTAERAAEKQATETFGPITKIRENPPLPTGHALLTNPALHSYADSLNADGTRTVWRTDSKGWYREARDKSAPTAKKTSIRKKRSS